MDESERAVEQIVKDWPELSERTKARLHAILSSASVEDPSATVSAA
jgi:hypothetical protein